MVRRYAAVLRLTLVAADIGLALIVVAGAINFRFGPTSGWPGGVSGSLPDPNLAVAVFVGMWIAVLWMHGLYRARERWTRRGEIAAVGIRIGIRQILVFLRDHGRNVRFMLVLGANARAKAFADLVERHAELGLVVICLLY